LLITGEMEDNGTLLAGRAYLRAAKFTDDPMAAARFRQMAEQAIGNHIDFEENGGGLEPTDLETQLAQEVAIADAWFADIERQEKQWIADGHDVDREFAAVHYNSLEQTIADAEQQVRSEKPYVRLSHRERDDRLLAMIVFVLVAGPVVLLCRIVGGIYWRRRRRAPGLRA
jgi:hypothetical protein